MSVRRERAVLVSVALPKRPWVGTDPLDELTGLATTAGAVIVDRETGHVARAQWSETRLGVWDWIARLHSGDFADWVSRVAYALVGLGLCILSITGYLITAQRTSGPS